MTKLKLLALQFALITLLIPHAAHSREVKRDPRIRAEWMLTHPVCPQPLWGNFSHFNGHRSRVSGIRSKGTSPSCQHLQQVILSARNPSLR